MKNHLNINYLELLDRVDSVVFTFNFKGQIIYANKNYYDFFKIYTMQRQNSVVGTSIYHFFHRDECIKLKKILTLLETNQSNLIKSDFIRSRRTGAMLRILEIQFERSNENSQTYLIAIGKDITDIINFYLELLTNRELEILKHIGNGHNTKGIAYTENVTESTISTLKQKIKKKINLKNTTDLENFAKRSLKLINEKYMLKSLEIELQTESIYKWKSQTDLPSDYIMTLDRDANIQYINHTLPCMKDEKDENNKTKIEELEKELKISENKFRDLFDFAPVGYLTINKIGKILDANIAALKLFGIEKKIITNMELGEFVVKEDREIFRNHLKLTLEKNTSVACEVNICCNKKISSCFNLNSISVVDADGKLKYYKTILTDISNVKRVDDEIIKKSIEEKEVLLTEIHHRVKNNFQIINSLLQMEKNYLKNNKNLKILKELQGRIKAISIIHDYLYKTKNISEIKFTEYIYSLTSGIATIYNQSICKINVKIDCDNFTLDTGKSTTCGLILNELITNSYKHAFPGGPQGDCIIEVTARQNSNNIEIVVSDNGIGIPGHVDVNNLDSLGLKLVPLLVKQLNGIYEVDLQNGTKFLLKFQKDNN